MTTQQSSLGPHVVWTVIVKSDPERVKKLHLNRGIKIYHDNNDLNPP